MRHLAKCIIGLTALLCLGSLVDPSVAQETDRKTARETRKTVRLLLRSGKECYDRGSCDSSQIFLDSALVLDPKNPDAFHGKAKAYAIVGDTTSALTLLADAVVIAPRSSRLKLLLARLHLMQDRPGDAAMLLDEVLAIKPNQGEALYLRGWSFVASGDTASAMEYLERAAAIGVEVSQR